MTAIIIEDDNSIRKGLKILLEKFSPNIALLAEAGTVHEGVQLIVTHQPDVLFLDIQLTDGSSFDILETLQLRLPEYAPQLVFITAYQEFAIKAFKFSALDYLLKPIDPLEFAAVIEKLHKNTAVQATHPQIQLLLESLNKPTANKKIALNSQTSTHIVAINDIIRCESDTNYTHFFMKEGKVILVSKTLKEYEELLTKEGFERIHQSHLININYIKEYAKKEGYFILTDGTEIPISSRKTAAVSEIINRITL